VIHAQQTKRRSLLYDLRWFSPNISRPLGAIVMPLRASLSHLFATPLRSLFTPRLCLCRCEGLLRLHQSLYRHATNIRTLQLSQAPAPHALPCSRSLCLMRRVRRRPPPPCRPPRSRLQRCKVMTPPPTYLPPFLPPVKLIMRSQHFAHAITGSPKLRSLPNNVPPTA
jgi:hypothetical protein